MSYGNIYKLTNLKNIYLIFEEIMFTYPQPLYPQAIKKLDFFLFNILWLLYCSVLLVGHMVAVVL